MKPAPNTDTIVAIATAPGPSGIGIVRISGSDAHRIAQHITKRNLENRLAVFCNFYSSQDTLIDKGIALYFKAPHSYSGEDTVELQAHGSPAVLQELLESVLALGESMGARMAEPGEFSRRAFLNGKHDLAQTAAIADLICSASAQAAQSAQRVIQGEFSKQVTQIETAIQNLRVQIEASLDFSGEEIDIISDAQISKELEDLIQTLSTLQTRSQQGERLRSGAEVVLAGKPNTGKSSLLNHISQRETAIVSPKAGTTRDIVRSQILLDGVPVTFLDTAGIQSSDDEIEQEGVVRTHQAVAHADVVVVLKDASCENENDTEHPLNGLEESETPMIIAYNKCDLMAQSVPAKHPERLYISAKTGAGIEDLMAAILGLVCAGSISEDALTVNRRCCDEMNKAQTLLQEAKAHATPDHFARDIIAHNLRAAHEKLATMLGEYGDEDLLGDIFAQFCVGK